MTIYCGLKPTGTVEVTVLVEVSITDTVFRFTNPTIFPFLFVTYTFFQSAVAANAKYVKIPSSSRKICFI